MNSMNGAALGAFGREVVYQPQTGGSATLKAIFEATREPEESSPGVYAALFVRLADLPKPPTRGDEVSIDGTSYKVFDVDADEAGGVVLRLRQA